MNKYYKGEPKLLVSVDCIVLGFENKKLQLLVGKRKVEPYSGKLSLYGGFVREDESLKEAANRVLFQCTGINDIYMRQVGAFGETDRDPGDRVISIAYCALINVSDYDNKLLEENDLQWVDINKLPELFGDHIEMVQIALSQLRKLINKDPLGSIFSQNSSRSHSFRMSTKRLWVLRLTNATSVSVSSKSTSLRRQSILIR